MTKQADRFGDPPALLVMGKLGSNFACKERPIHQKLSRKRQQLIWDKKSWLSA